MSTIAQPFWQAIDLLVETSTLVIDRPKGARHPRYPDFVYPLDYGYLDGTHAVDGGGLDVWRGTQPEALVTAVVCTIDLVKRDVELKLLIGCSEDDIAVVLNVTNNSPFMKGMLISRSSHNLPAGI